MIFQIEAYNANVKHIGERVHIYLCTEGGSEIPELKERLGRESEGEGKMFELYVWDGERYIFATVQKICSEILEQVLGYAGMAGVELSLSDIFRTLKRMDE